eukprot:gb/GECG01006646.1/.p1 GENE.gb/GECG01006646.1/~~gb/GECG01006646.1/.p1  ORF type:complete len:199 (+),score=21.67 gb/GECG01006646.1/:1-597(+)
MLRYSILLWFVAAVNAHEVESRIIRKELQAKNIVKALNIPGFNVEENYFISGLSRCQPLMDQRCGKNDPSWRATMCDNRSEADSFRTNPNRVPIGDVDGVRRLFQFFYCERKDGTDEEPSFKMKGSLDGPKTTHEKYERGLEDNPFDGSILEAMEDASFHKHCSETERPQVICLQQHLLEKPSWSSCNCWYRDGFERL